MIVYARPYKGLVTFLLWFLLFFLIDKSGSVPSNMSQANCVVFDISYKFLNFGNFWSWSLFYSFIWMYDLYFEKSFKLIYFGLNIKQLAFPIIFIHIWIL